MAGRIRRGLVADTDRQVRNLALLQKFLSISADAGACPDQLVLDVGVLELLAEVARNERGAHSKK